MTNPSYRYGGQIFERMLETGKPIVVAVNKVKEGDRGGGRDSAHYRLTGRVYHAKLSFSTGLSPPLQFAVSSHRSNENSICAVSDVQHASYLCLPIRWVVLRGANQKQTVVPVSACNDVDPVDRHEVRRGQLSRQASVRFLREKCTWSDKKKKVLADFERSRNFLYNHRHH